MRRTGAQILWDMLEHEGVEVVFGIPGGQIMDVYDAHRTSRVRHILMRHEQCAAHAADGYARASGRVGVAMATSGPGATNLVTGIATAMMDSSPMVCITGQVPTPVIGSDAFQEVDITGITLPITKHNYLVTDVNDLPAIIHEAFYIARTGRPGPVLIDIPKDVQRAETELVLPDPEVRLPGGDHRFGKLPDEQALRRAAELIAQAQRPVILAGHGVLLSGAREPLRKLAELTRTPVALTLLGKGAFPESHPLSLGLMGMHGEAYVNRAIQESDLLLALGMRFDDRVTGRLADYAPQAKKIHIDLDAAELNKIVRADVPILADLREALERLLPLIERVEERAWLQRIEEWRDEARRRDIGQRAPNGRLVTPHVVQAIRRATRGQAIVVTDVGQHQMWTAQYYSSDEPNFLLTSGGLGTMGFGLPAAIGAQVACPEREVWLVVGDGGFQMTMHDLATIVQERLPIRIAISNNHCLGMVRQWQELFYDKHYEATLLQNPDFVLLAQAYGIPARHVTRVEEVQEAIAAARACPQAMILDFQVVQQGEEGNVYPMVAPGRALHDMIRRPEPNREPCDEIE